MKNPPGQPLNCCCQVHGIYLEEQWSSKSRFWNLLGIWSSHPLVMDRPTVRFRRQVDSSVLRWTDHLSYFHTHVIPNTNMLGISHVLTSKKCVIALRLINLKICSIAIHSPMSHNFEHLIYKTFAFRWHWSERLIATTSLRMPFADVDSGQLLY
jgi:hypothetical protein